MNSEILRVIDSIQLFDAKNVVTPGNWKQGDKVILPTAEKASDYPNPVEIVDLPSGKDYLRYTKI